MTLEFDFSRDVEFNRLVARRPGVDLSVLVLELARDCDPGLDFGPTLQWIAERGAELRSRISRTSSEREVLEQAARIIHTEAGIAGAAEAYEEANGSFLNRVIELRRGIPISLAVLYMSVCRAAGFELMGVSTPMHFLTRMDSADGPLFFDGFSGRILGEEEVVTWLSALSRVSPAVLLRSLEPCEDRQIVVRMLTNLKVLFARREDWSSVWPVQNRLLALNPSEYSERRDLSLVALRSNRPGVALRMLQSLFKDAPAEDRPLLTQQIDQAKHAIQQWN